MQDFCCGAAKSHAEKHRGGNELPCKWCETHSRSVRFFGGCDPDTQG
jgi:hypothetical protein